MNRWRNWKPPIFTDSPKLEPSKPSKPGSVGFVGSESGASEKIAGGFVGSVGSNPVESQKITPADALALVNASGVRMATHEGHRVNAVSAVKDTALLRQALEILGYGGCRVLHLDTAPYRGKSSDAIAEAIGDRS